MTVQKTEMFIAGTPEAKRSLHKLACNWWLPLIEGVLGIAIGGYAAMNFGLGFEAIAMVVAVFLLTSGIVGLAGAMVSGDYEGKVVTVVLSVLRLIGGLVLVMIPGMAEMYLLIVAGASFLTLAINIMVLAICMKKYDLKGWGWMLALGVLTLVNAIVIIANPLISVVMISASVCAELVVSGAHDVAIAIQMKKLKNALEQ